MNRITDEFTHFKDIFLNYGKIAESFQGFCEGAVLHYNSLNEANNRRFFNTLFLNYINIFNYIQKANINIEYFKNYNKEITELVDKYNKVIKKTEELINNFEQNYVVVDVEKFCVELSEYEYKIAKRIEYWQTRGRFTKVSDKKEVNYLKLLISNLNRAARDNDYMLESNQGKILNVLLEMNSIENRLYTSISYLDKINQMNNLNQQGKLDIIPYDKINDINIIVNENKSIIVECNKNEDKDVSDNSLNKTNSVNTVNELKKVEANKKPASNINKDINKWKAMANFKSAVW
jgi:hypothetical protein